MDGSGHWSVEQKNPIYVTETTYGLTPIRFDENKRPFFQPEWALLLALHQGETAQVKSFIQRGAPLNSSMSFLLNGRTAFDEITRRHKQEMKPSQINACVKTYLAKGNPSEKDLKKYLSSALASKRFGVAELMWKSLLKKRASISLQDRLTWTSDFLSPVASFRDAYLEKDNLSGIISKDFPYREFIMEISKRWHEQLLVSPYTPSPADVRETFLPDVKNSLSVSNSSGVNAKIECDVYGNLVFYNESMFDAFRTFWFNNLKDKIPFSASCWSCHKNSPGELLGYPEGTWSLANILQWLNMPEEAAEVEKQQLQSLPTSEIKQKHARL